MSKLSPPPPTASPASNSVRRSRNDLSGATASGRQNGKRRASIVGVFVNTSPPVLS